MKNLFLSLLLTITCGFVTQANAQNNSDKNNNQKIESFDQMLSEIEKGMEEMLETLRSEQFQRDLEEAVEEARGELNVTRDANGNLLFNGEILDLNGFTEPGNDILELFKNDFHISGDLSEMMSESGSLLQEFFDSVEEELELNYQFFEDLELNFEFDNDGDCSDKRKKGSGTSTL